TSVARASAKSRSMRAPPPYQNPHLSRYSVSASPDFARSGAGEPDSYPLRMDPASAGSVFQRAQTTEATVAGPPGSTLTTSIRTPAEDLFHRAQIFGDAIQPDRLALERFGDPRHLRRDVPVLRLLDRLPHARHRLDAIACVESRRVEEVL